MAMLYRILVFKTRLCLIAMMCYTSAIAEQTIVDRVLWEKRPIPFSLEVGKERLAHFPTEVRYWIPNSLEDTLSILAVNGVLYVTAHREFEKTRIRVQSLDSQKIYLLDLNASKDNAATDELIVMDRDHVESKSIESEHEKPLFDWYIRLTRFAAQSLYAQERLLPSASDIKTVDVDSQTPVPLVRGGDIEAIPIKSWRGGGYYVTAVVLRNLSTDDIAIKHRASMANRLIQRTLILTDDIRGAWLAVTPQHTTLEATGHNDVTTLYLLSERSFMEAFNG